MPEPFELVTQRLRLVPLSLELLLLERDDPLALAAALGAATHVAGDLVDGRPEPELLDALQQMVRATTEHPDEWPWSTDWALITRDEGVIIGGCCFHGPPDDSGRAELGYGLFSPDRGRGYMTEAVQRMIAWAFEAPIVREVIAETIVGNLPSERVLQRCGLTRHHEEGSSVWWSLTREDSVVLRTAMQGG